MDPEISEAFGKFTSLTHVARKATLPVQNRTNLKVDFFESLNPPRCHMGKKFGFHRWPLKLPAN